jgi:HEPN domain-containing protein
MNETVKEWLRKASLDLATARRELSAVDEPNLDAVCFHAQQCVEKAMKAILIHLQVLPPKTHDLALLSRLITEAVPPWSWPTEDLRFLSRASVDFRYPGESADPDEAREALGIATEIHRALLTLSEVHGQPDA